MSDLIRHATAAAHLIRDLRDALDAPTLGPRTRLILARRALYRYDTTISAGSGQPADTAGRDSRRGPATAAPTDKHHSLPGAGGPAGAHPDGVCRWCATNGVTPAVCCCVKSCGARCPIPADADDTLVVPRPAADPALSGRHAAPDDDAATVVMPLISGVRGGW